MNRPPSPGPAGIQKIALGRELTMMKAETLDKSDIRYVKSDDGASIALWTIGQGRPLIYATGAPWNQIELWDAPQCRQWYQRLNRHRQIVRYDMRGTGLSQREVQDFSLDAQVADLRAVADAMGSEPFDLFGGTGGATVALAYAAQFPQRVDRLIVWCGWARSEDLISSRLRAWSGLIDQDWDLLAETCAQLVLGWSGGELGRLASEQLQANISRDTMRVAIVALRKYDVTARLDSIAAPTLVMHRRGINWIPAEAAQRIASRISNSRLLVLDGESPAPFIGDMESAAQAMGQFLDAPSSQSGQIAEPPGGLTQRELEVLRLIAGGQTNNEIAESLFLSVRTVERHIGNIYGKIDARGRADATAFAMTNHLI